MNNNMPNNFNNGGGMNNNPNGVSNPKVDNANRQTMSGQGGAASVNSNVMQGQSGMVNNPGVMQGVSNVPREAGIMQGQAVSDNNNQTVVVPGQGHSGVNNYTMQYEGAGNAQGTGNFQNNNVNNVPTSNPSNFNGPVNGSTIPSTSANNFNNSNDGIKPIAKDINIPKGVGLQNNQVNNVSSFNAPNNGVSSNIGQVPNNMNNSGMVNSQNGNNFSKNMASNPNGGNNLNNNMTSNANQNNNTIGNQNVNNTGAINQNAKPNSVGSSNNYFGQINSMNNQNVNPSSISSGTGIQPTGNNQNGVSLVGQTNASEQTIVPDMDMNKPKKKFPLSVREMVLIGIALIGIVVVIIIYT